MTNTPFAPNEVTASRALDVIARLRATAEAIDLLEEPPTADVTLVFLIWGWYQRISRQADLVAIAYKSGFSSEASPLVRSLSEHAVAIRWLADAGLDGVKAVTAAHPEFQLGLRAQMGIDEWKHPALSIEEPPQRDMTRSTHRDEFASFEVLYWLYEMPYATYKLESQSAHPSYVTALEYAEYRQDGVFQPLVVPATETFAAPLEAARCAIVAALVLQTIISDPALDSAIGFAFDHLGIRFDLPERREKELKGDPGAVLDDLLIAAAAECERASGDTGYLQRYLSQPAPEAEEVLNRVRRNLQSVVGKLQSIQADFRS